MNNRLTLPVTVLAILLAAALEQPLAALLIVVVQIGGVALQRRAEGRATATLRALEEELAGAPDLRRARVVELLRKAQASKAPLQQIIDRYVVWFTPATLVVAALVFAATRDWLRVLAVLAVATPVPLLLAVPIATLGGIGRAARRHIIVRHGATLERLGAIDIVAFDKIGTITVGTPRLTAVRVAPGFTRADVLKLAAAMEQGSSHLLARALVTAAEAEGVAVPRGAEHREMPGEGVSGRVGGRDVRLGARRFVLPHCECGANVADHLEGDDATLRAYFGVDGRLAVIFEYADEIRPDLAAALARLRERGVRRFVLLSGDHTPIARAVAGRAGIRETYGDMTPADKATFIERLRSEGCGVLLVGDGQNDTPALTMADVGVALATHGRGGGITTEAADIILLVDSLACLSDAIDVGARTLRIARRSITIGLGLGAVATLVAAFGGLVPAAGAAVQALIDVVVIAGALRAAGEPLLAGVLTNVRDEKRNVKRDAPRRPTPLIEPSSSVI